MSFASSVARVTIDGEVHPMLDRNLGYCAGCLIEVRPGQTLHAEVPYSEFGIAEKDYEKLKELSFKPVTTSCGSE